MSIKGIYDIHCHIVPGVDDGATDIGETVKLLRMEYEQGVRTVITTPHFRFRMFETPAEKVREQFRLVEKAASEISPDLHVYLGCEFHADKELGFKEYGDLAHGLKKITYSCINHNDAVYTYEKKGDIILERLVEFYRDNTLFLPPEYRVENFIHETNEDKKMLQERLICDYISGMMDSYAISQYEKITGEQFSKIVL